MGMQRKELRRDGARVWAERKCDVSINVASRKIDEL